MLTYQDMIAETEGKPAEALEQFVTKCINQHKSSAVYRNAVAADEYDHQRNVTIRQVQAMLAQAARQGVAAAQVNIAIASNFFRRFNVQRCSYLLGNGATFTHTERRVNDAGIIVNVDTTKEALGQDYDGQLYKWAYFALIHGECYAYDDTQRLYIFPVTQFAPLVDEDTDEPRAGVRFWRIDDEHPMKAWLYTEQGIYEFATDSRTGQALHLVDANPRPYIAVTRESKARGAVQVGTVTPKAFPIVRMYGNSLHQSTLIGFREKIDAWDLIASGLAKDLREVAAIYWIMSNQGGMTQAELNKMLADIMENHIINVDGTGFDGTTRDAMTPYTTEVPHQGRLSFLDALEQSMYKDFGALDVHSISAGSTNDHIDAAYQPLDEEADGLEMQVIEAVRKQLAIRGIDDTPTFDRGESKNITELTNAVMAAANYLDDEAVLDHLPFITVDERDAILQRRDREGAARIAVDIDAARARAALEGETA
jgi:hypothetical protein